jgi:hypothetical protein
MSTRSRPKVSAVLTRWMFGTALISWRYLWETTPLHRVEREGGGAEDLPPRLPAETLDDTVQLASDGVGPLFHRRFWVRIVEARLTAYQLMARVVSDFKDFVPSEVVAVRSSRVVGDTLQVGDELVVEMPGPWDGPVRVVHVDDACLRLATLRGHLEAGQVEFRAHHTGDTVIFEIEVWARPGTLLVHLLYSHLRLAKEMQLNMWVRFCLAAAATAGGRPADGVHIRTHRVGARDSEPCA